LSGCDLQVISGENKFGIISDFDDTVIVSNVNNKVKLLTNTFSKNYTQRELVKGIASTYKKELNSKSLINDAPLFFVTGSPRQIQTSIEHFLDLHDFPDRIIISKKLNGDNSDPLFDQFSYKTAKIKELFIMFPHIKFLLVGDNGEKDPEVYHHLQQEFSEQVSGVWIRKVSLDTDRKRFIGQKLFNEF